MHKGERVVEEERSSIGLIKDKIEKPAPGLFKPGAGFSLKCS
jgi:hypothetical protein